MSHLTLTSYIGPSNKECNGWNVRIPKRRKLECNYNYFNLVCKPKIFEPLELIVIFIKQETLTPPGHLVSPLVCRGPWMSTVVLYCWCHSDSVSVSSFVFYIDDDAKYFPLKLKRWQYFYNSTLKSNLHVRQQWVYLHDITISVIYCTNLLSNPWSLRGSRNLSWKLWRALGEYTSLAPPTKFCRLAFYIIHYCGRT